MPEFPFPTRVDDDLRALFAHDRIDAQVNHLGFSSIGPGEGSAEVRNAEGATLAHFGHVDGAAGFLVRRAGAWVTVQAYAEAEIAEASAGLTSRLDEHAARLGTAEGRLDSHAQRLGAAENDIGELQAGKVSQSTHNALAARVGALEGRADSQASRIGRAENEIDKIIVAVNQLKERVGDLDGGSKEPLPPNPKG